MSDSVDLSCHDIGHHDEGLRVRVFTRAELHTLRAEILADSGLPEADLHERAQAWTLTPQQRGTYELLRSIDWLLEADEDSAVS